VPYPKEAVQFASQREVRLFKQTSEYDRLLKAYTLNWFYFVTTATYYEKRNWMLTPENQHLDVGFPQECHIKNTTRL
jgi:hypothetical protein